MPSFKSDTNIFTPISKALFHPAKESHDEIRNPKVYNTVDIKTKGLIYSKHYKTPVNGKINVPLFMSEKSAYAYIAKESVDYDWYRSPDQYNTYDIRTKTGPVLNPVVPSSTEQRIESTKTHFQIMDKIHPHAKLGTAIVEAHAKIGKNAQTVAEQSAKYGAYLAKTASDNNDAIKRASMGAPASEFKIQKDKDDISKFFFEKYSQEMKDSITKAPNGLFAKMHQLRVNKKYDKNINPNPAVDGSIAIGANVLAYFDKINKDIPTRDEEKHAGIATGENDDDDDDDDDDEQQEINKEIEQKWRNQRALEKQERDEQQERDDEIDQILQTEQQERDDEIEQNLRLEQQGQLEQQDLVEEEEEKVEDLRTPKDIAMDGQFNILKTTASKIRFLLQLYAISKRNQSGLINDIKKYDINVGKINKSEKGITAFLTKKTMTDPNYIEKIVRLSDTRIIDNLNKSSRSY